MTLSAIPRAVFGLGRRKPFFLAVFVVALTLVAVFLLTRSGSTTPASNFYEVKRGDFLISIVEGGTLEAVTEVSIRNEVEGTARIIFIAPEGSYVKKGDLLVELDSSASQDAANLQQINVEKAQFALVQAQQQLDIQKSTAESEAAAATLKVEFAVSDLDKYVKGEALQLQRNAQIEITNVLETLKIAEERLRWTKELYKQGFETKSNLDKDELSVFQSKLKLEQAEKALWMFEEFDRKKRKRELDAALQEANENLARVKLQGERIMAQYLADVETQKSTLELNRTKLERDLKQLLATKIYAPQDGLVVYPSGSGRFSNESMIEEGAVVRNRQELIKLPDISEMKLQVKIHESHINQVHAGQQAFIVLDSMPDQRLRGVVNKVGLLPDGQSRWSNPNLKVYATEILVTDDLPDVKPGVSARAEIIITNLPQALTVPIQSVTTRQGQQVVFLANQPQRPVPVSIGMYNTKFIEITSGLNAGDRVLLAPPFDTDEKDLGGAILAEGEAMPAGATNQPPVNASRNGNGGREGGRNGRPNAAPLSTLTGATPDDIAQEPPGTPRGDGPPREGRSTRRRPGSGPGGEMGPGGDKTGTDRTGTERFGGERGSGERPGGERSGGNRPGREEMMKQFDTDGDGQLNETERAAMRERFSRDRPPRTGPPAEGSPRQGAPE